MCNYDIIVAKIYDYALIDSFLGSAGLIDSPTSSDTLLCGTVCGTTDVSTNSLIKNCGIWRRERSQTLAASVILYIIIIILYYLYYYIIIIYNQLYHI